MLGTFLVSWKASMSETQQGGAAGDWAFAPQRWPDDRAAVNARMYQCIMHALNSMYDTLDKRIPALPAKIVYAAQQPGL